jgi:hypothetical protein
MDENKLEELKQINKTLKGISITITIGVVIMFIGFFL